MSSTVARYVGVQAVHCTETPGQGADSIPDPTWKPCAPVQAVSAQWAPLFVILTKVPVDCDQTQL